MNRLYSVEAIQVVLDKQLLRATNRAAKKRAVNRSALVREALREYLRRLDTAERERQDRAGYLRTPDSEFEAWDQVAAWPGD